MNKLSMRDLLNERVVLEEGRFTSEKFVVYFIPKDVVIDFVYNRQASTLVDTISVYDSGVVVFNTVPSKSAVRVLRQVHLDAQVFVVR